LSNHDDSGDWFLSYANENREFDANRGHEERSILMLFAMKTVILAAAVTLLHGFALAQEPSSTSLERLLEVTQARKTNDAVIQQSTAALAGMFEEATALKNLTGERRIRTEKAAASFLQKMNGIISEELAWERVKILTLQLYREIFTQKEIDDLIVFYETPTGKAFAEKMPVMLQKSTSLMQKRVEAVMSRMQPAFAEALSGLTVPEAPR
jgi:hypothetical protein